MARKKAQVASQYKGDEKQKKPRLSQSDVPSVSLAQALRIPRAISDNYGNAPTKPLRIAEAIDMTVSSGHFRLLCGASIAYGLTEGGYAADTISLTPLGRRIVAPTTEDGDRVAMREASMKPQIISDFLTRYNNHKLPPDKIAHNVFEEMGVPRDKAARTLSIILENAREVGFIREIKGQLYVDLDTSAPTATTKNDEETQEISSDEVPETVSHENTGSDAAPISNTLKFVEKKTQPNNRVFITHGKNKEIVVQLKELLVFGNFEPIVSVERETVSKPVPDKVMDDMRLCYAAIIHVGTEMRVVDSEGKEHRILNPNVLIEIGAAMALYGRKFILLVEKGVTLPTNLSGLYEVRYEGDKLDYEATMKLLKAFNDFKS